MLAGEEKGITSKNVKKLASQDNKDKEINRLLGKDPLQGLSKLGLSADWAVNVISQVGNYSESFERNLGMSSALKVARGMQEHFRSPPPQPRPDQSTQQGYQQQKHQLQTMSSYRW